MVVALSSGARFGFVASQKHVFGAAVSFTLRLVLIGLGLHEVLARWPILTQLIQWGGVAFLLYMAWKLAADDGRLDAEGTATAPSMLYGAIMQWLNPKAWLACVAGMGLFVADGDAAQVWLVPGVGRVEWPIAHVRAETQLVLQVRQPGRVDVHHLVRPRLIGDGIAGVYVAGGSSTPPCRR